jgi:uncharacterized protein (DUF2236 family)
MSLRLVPPLPAGTPGDPGLTGPGSVTWRVCRERVVPLGGLSALLLQLAHPLVAAGVAEHSSLAPARLRFWGHYHVAVVRSRPAAGPSADLLSTDAGSGDR